MAIFHYYVSLPEGKNHDKSAHVMEAVGPSHVMVAVGPGAPALFLPVWQSQRSCHPQIDGKMMRK